MAGKGVVPSLMVGEGVVPSLSVSLSFSLFLEFRADSASRARASGPCSNLDEGRLALARHKRGLPHPRL